jgi:hypothetical protein
MQQAKTYGTFQGVRALYGGRRKASIYFNRKIRLLTLLYIKNIPDLEATVDITNAKTSRSSVRSHV